LPAEPEENTVAASVGTYPIVPAATVFSSGSAGNYTVTYVAGTLTVKPAPLVIAADGATSTYGQATSFRPTAFTATGLAGGDTLGGVTETSPGAAATAGAGTYAIVPEGAIFSAGSASNYAITYASGTLTVNPAPLVIRADDATRTYGQAAAFPGTAFTATDLEGGDAVASVTESSPGAAPTAGVGTYPIVPGAATFAAGSAGNYAITYADGTLIVNPAPLVITAEGATKSYGQAAALPGTAFTASGLLNGDAIAGVTETSAGAPATAAVGNDPIVPSAAVFSAGSAGNYAMTYASGTLTITPATPTISWRQPAATTQGTPLGPAQLDATASVPGTFTYAPAAGTILAAGQGQALSVTFTPADPADYTAAHGSTTLNVLTPPQVASVAPASSKKGIASFTVSYNEPLSPGSAASAALYHVLAAVTKVVKRHKQTLYTKPLAIAGVSPSGGGTAVTVTLAKPYKGKVQVGVQGTITGANGASDSINALMDLA
jgi:hypothetical protein